METDFQGFHEISQFSTHSVLSSDEVMKYQLKVLESFKTEDIPWQDKTVMNDAVGKEDFQQIMSEWQNHLGSLQITEPEDVDVPLDILNTSDVLFDDKSPILSKALNCLIPKLENPSDLIDIKQEPIFESDAYTEITNQQVYSECIKPEPTFDSCDYTGSLKSESSFDSDPSELYNKFQNDQKYFSSSLKSEPTVVRKLSLLNGEKEILGKNIIGLHSLNEIKENPDQNCQVTSTVINGKRYKIIIKPKSQKLKNFNEEKIKKTLIKKLTKCNLPKMEPKEDEIISEMRNGNYDVPILGNDTLLNWDVNWFDNNWDTPADNNFSDVKVKNETETPKKVPPLKIKIPKTKKCKKKKTQVKSDEEIDVETVGDKGEKSEARKAEESVQKTQDVKKDNENIKNSLPKEMVERIESLKRKKDGKIPLVQIIPARKNVRSGTRMHDAAATINRNKLLKIVSGGDTVQLDHDYCSNTLKNFESPQKNNTKSSSEANLTEKNPKKDSGMESGDVSDASEDPQTPESISNLQSIQEINNKLLEQTRTGKAGVITKVAAAFFRATNVITSNGNPSNSDVVKTMVVSNGNKALTNDAPVSSACKSDGDKSDIVPSGSSDINNSKDKVSKTDVESDKSNISSIEPINAAQPERPKKKLKLEEYLSRRNGKIVNSGKETINDERKDNVLNNVEINADKPVPDKPEPAKEIKPTKEDSKDEKNCLDPKKEGGSSNIRSSSQSNSDLGKKSRRCRSRRSSSTSSGEREDRRNKDRSSRSRSSWRGSRRDSWSRHRNRSSTSSERRRSYWSRSLSRSSSRESSSSSDRSGGRRKRRVSPVWYHRRSRSRSISRERSRSRNRGYSNRRRQNHYYNRNFSSRRSRSPYRNYSMREKQRQIEERRVIYIGRIEEGMTEAKLRERFGVFGPIVEISLHFREYGDNYGFVTYAYKDDAYDAMEHGNDDPSLPRYQLCFGGRRGFCKERYADLDSMPTSYSGFNDTPVLRSSEESFDLLLKEAQAKLKQRINKAENKS